MFLGNNFLESKYTIGRYESSTSTIKYFQGLQNDLRSLLSYFKEAHEAIFRRIVMSGVMESQQRQTVLPSRTETPTPVHIPNPQPSLIRRPLLRNVRNELGSADNDILTIESDQENLSSFDVSGPSARTLRGIFAKRVKKSLRPLQSREASETNLNLKVNSIRSPRVSISEDESVDPSSPHGKKKRIAAGFRQRWLKSPKSSMGSKESAKEEGGGMHRSISMISGEGGFLGGETSRQQSIESTLPAPADIRPRLSFRSSGHGDKGVLKRGRFQESSSQEDENPRSRGMYGFWFGLFHRRPLLESICFIYGRFGDPSQLDQKAYVLGVVWFDFVPPSFFLRNCFGVTSDSVSVDQAYKKY